MHELYPHQEDALARMKNGCVLWGDVGSGKSKVAAAYYVKMEADADVYVITTAKKRDSLDWVGEFAQFGIGRHRDATVAGGILTVDSWNNIGKYRDVVGGFFIFDEQRLVGAGDWTTAFLRIAKRNRWVLLTATPGDTWLDYIPVFLANGFYKNRSEFKREHVVYAPYVKFPKVDRYINVGRLLRQRNELLVEMSFSRRTTRREIELDVGYDRALLEKVVKDRWNVFENRPLRDVAEMFSVARKVVNSHSDRIQTTLTLLREHPKLIIFYNFNYELEALRTALGSVRSTSMSTSTSETGVSTPTDSTGKKLLSGCRKNCEKGSATVCCGTQKDVSTSDSETWTACRCPLTESSPDAGQSGKSGRSSRTSTLPGSTPVQVSGLHRWLTEQEKLPSGKQCTKRPSGSATGTRTKTASSGSMASTSTPTITDGSESIRSFIGLEEFKSIPPSTETGTTLMEEPGFTRPTKYRLSGSDTGKTTSPLSIAEWNGHKHEPIPDTDRWVYLVQYAAGAEGWNCIETDAMLFYSLPYSYKQWHQAKGRTDRLNTPFEELFYYTLLSNSFIDRAIKKCLGQKRNFNESGYVRDIKDKKV